MNKYEKIELCKNFFDALSAELDSRYQVVGSCNADISRYLIPMGTESEITYSSKPENSFRVSDHWNWYSSTIKCSNERYIQCYSRQLPWAHKRPAPGKASRPINASCVCAFIDGSYHVIFGEIYDRSSRTWSWISADPKEIAAKFA